MDSSSRIFSFDMETGESNRRGDVPAELTSRPPGGFGLSTLGAQASGVRVRRGHGLERAVRARTEELEDEPATPLHAEENRPLALQCPDLPPAAASVFTRRDPDDR